MAKRVSSLDSRKRVRRTFGHLSEVAQMPNLIDVQRSSYDQFLQLGVAKQDRTSVGLQEAFSSVFQFMILLAGQSCSLNLMSLKHQNMMLTNVSSAGSPMHRP